MSDHLSDPQVRKEMEKGFERAQGVLLRGRDMETLSEFEAAWPAMKEELDAESDALFAQYRQNGWSLMHYAAWWGKDLVVLEYVLARSGEDPREVLAWETRAGETPLLYLGFNPSANVDMLNFLAQHCAQLTAKDEYGTTLVHNLARSLIDDEITSLSRDQEVAISDVLVAAVQLMGKDALDVQDIDPEIMFKDLNADAEGHTPRALLSRDGRWQELLRRIDSLPGTGSAAASAEAVASEEATPSTESKEEA